MSLDSFITDFSNKKVLILGLGVLGGGSTVIKLFQQFNCQIWITDQKNESVFENMLTEIGSTNISGTTFGPHTHTDIDWADVIIKNPAVPIESEIVQYAVAQHKYLTSEAALFLKYTSTKTIGITGTRGKTTTTQATHFILTQLLQKKILLGGNIQDKAALSLLFEESADAISVLELSSFALESCHTAQVSPSIAAITNLYPDHLNRYSSLQEYAQAKSAIFQYQLANGTVFFRSDDAWTPYFLSLQPHSPQQVQILEELRQEPPHLGGEHNLWNLSFAVMLAKTTGVELTQALEAARLFQGVEYRQQVIGQSPSTTFINDSTSTTPEALMAALDNFPQATMIIGGTTKNLPLVNLAIKLNNFPGELYFLQGSGTSELLQAMNQSQHIVYHSLQDAFQAAVNNRPPTLVFSPGFTSFELFANEFDRAQQFDQLVRSSLAS